MKHEPTVAEAISEYMCTMPLGYTFLCQCHDRDGMKSLVSQAVTKLNMRAVFADHENGIQIKLEKV